MPWILTWRRSCIHRMLFAEPTYVDTQCFSYTTPRYICGGGSNIGSGHGGSFVRWKSQGKLFVVEIRWIRVCR